MSRPKIHLIQDPMRMPAKPEEKGWSLCGRKMEAELLIKEMNEQVTCGMCKRLFNKKIRKSQGKAW